MAKKPPPRLVFMRTGADWEGLYVDGELAWEGHSIPLSTLAKHAGFEIEERRTVMGDDETLPADLGDVFCGERRR